MNTSIKYKSDEKIITKFLEKVYEKFYYEGFTALGINMEVFGKVWLNYSFKYSII